jgi:hypothetical protein
MQNLLQEQPGYSSANHQAMLKSLMIKTKIWLISSEQHYIISVQAASGMNVEKNRNTRVLNREVLITNFPPPETKKQQTTAPAKQAELWQPTLE